MSQQAATHRIVSIGLEPITQRTTMINQLAKLLRDRRTVMTLAIFCSSVAAVSMGAPARADMGQNSIGPSIKFGNGQTAVGIDSKFGVADNISARPYIYFPSGGTNFGSALTYDFNLKNTASNMQIKPFLGGTVDFTNGSGINYTTVGLTGGADFDVTDAIRLKAALNVPLSNDSGQTTAVVLGAGYRF
jgi:hypothetical protein